MHLPLASGFPLALGFGNGMEWILIFMVVLLLFGSKKLPELARGLGRSMHEFRKAKEDFESEIHAAKTELTVTEAPNRQLHQNTTVVTEAAMNQNDELQRQVRELQDQLRAMQSPATTAPTAPAMVAASALPTENVMAHRDAVVAAMPVELTPVEPGFAVPPPGGTVQTGKLG